MLPKKLTFKLSTMFLETADCMALNGTVVPFSSETEVPLGAAGPAGSRAGAGGALAAGAGVGIGAAGAIVVAARHPQACPRLFNLLFACKHLVHYLEAQSLPG